MNTRLEHLIGHKPNLMLTGYWPWQSVLNGSRARAKNRGLKFNLTHDWARERYTGSCEQPTGKRNMFSLSLDRIAHNGDYTKDNCRFVLWGLNAMRGDNGLDLDLVRIAKAIADRYIMVTDIDQTVIKLAG